MSEIIKAVVLDLGEVLIRLDFSRVMEALGFPPNQSVAQWLKNMDLWQIYDKFERGLISEDDFFKPLPELRAVWNTVLQESIPNGLEILKTLRKTTRLFALTNSNETHLRHAASHYPMLAEFERVFSSHEIGARKPEPKIYQFVEKAIGISAGQLLFIDDRPENVQGAKLLGWNAELCKKSPEDLISALKRYGLT